MSKHLLSIIFILLLLFGCSEGRNPILEDELIVIKDIIENDPDSAQILINSIDNNLQEGKYILDESINYELLKLKYQLGYKFKDYDRIESVANYYDKFGTIDEKLKSQYFLGLYYLDRGDLPMALEIFNSCIKIVDNNNYKSDPILVSKIYSQMSGIFHKQNLSYYEIDALTKARYYSDLAGDSILSLRYEDLLVMPYNYLGETDSVIAISNRTAEKYYKFGLDSIGNIKQENALFAYIQKKDFNKVAQIINIYETGTGLFDDKGNIKNGYEIYYYLKGLYCLEIDKTNEAEHYFRNLLSYKNKINDLEAAYRGLLLLYKKENKLDSIGKYAQLYCEINDTLQIKNKNAEVARMQAAFNYEMHKQKSEKLAQTVKKQQTMMWISIIAFIVVAIILGESFRQYKNKKIQEYLEEKDHYNEKIALIQKLNSDKEAQKKIIDNLIAETKQLKSAIDSEVRTEQTDSESCQNEKLVHNLHIRALKPIDASQYFDDDKWHDILKYAEKTDSRFVSYLYQRDLSLMEKKVAVLIRLDFSDNEIMALLDCSIGSSYSNCKLRINKKLFKTESAKRLRYYISKWK